jgi:hypothetical protein
MHRKRRRKRKSVGGGLVRLRIVIFVKKYLSNLIDMSNPTIYI